MCTESVLIEASTGGVDRFRGPVLSPACIAVVVAIWIFLVVGQGERQRDRPSPYGVPSFLVLEQIMSLPVDVLPVAPSGEQKAPGVTKAAVDEDGAAVVGAAVVGGTVVGAAVVATAAAVVAGAADVEVEVDVDGTDVVGGAVVEVTSEVADVVGRSC